MNLNWLFRNRKVAIKKYTSDEWWNSFLYEIAYRFPEKTHPFIFKMTGKIYVFLKLKEQDFYADIFKQENSSFFNNLMKERLLNKYDYPRPIERNFNEIQNDQLNSLTLPEIHDKHFWEAI